MHDGLTIGRTTRSLREASKAHVEDSSKIPKTVKKNLGTVRQLLRSDPFNSWISFTNIITVEIKLN